MPFRLVTFGELSLRDAGTGRKPAIPRKALALMAVLASRGSEGVTRETILSLLWPNAEGSGRGALKQTIYELRQTLGNHNVIAGTSELSLEATEITSDVVELERAYRAEDWTRVIQLYGGRFLDHFHLKESAEFEHWLDRTRQHYSELFRKALEKNALSAETSGDANAAVQLWRRLSVEDPRDGRIALGLLNALNAAGETAGALKHYEIHKLLLHDQLGADPDIELSSAAERLRTRKPGGSAKPEEAIVVGAGMIVEPGRTAGSTSSASEAPPARADRRKFSVHRRWLFGFAVLVIAAVAIPLAATRHGSDRLRIVDSIELPKNASTRVSVDADLNRIYSDGAASFNHALAIVDGVTRRVRTVPHGSGVIADPLTHWYWAGDYGGRFVVIRNGRTDAEIGRVPVPGCPHTFAASGKWILVAQQCDDQISVIDSRTRELVRNIPIATLSRAEVGGAKGMGEIFVNTNTGVAYFWKDMIPHRLDTNTWQIGETSGFGGQVVAIDEANNRLYVRLAEGLRVIDGRNERILGDIQLSGIPRGRVAVGFGGRRIYAVTLSGLSVIDGRTHRVIRTNTFDDGFVPSDVAADDARGRAYVVGEYGNGRRFLKIVDLRDQ